MFGLGDVDEDMLGGGVEAAVEAAVRGTSSAPAPEPVGEVPLLVFEIEADREGAEAKR